MSIFKRLVDYVKSFNPFKLEYDFTNCCDLTNHHYAYLPTVSGSFTDPCPLQITKKKTAKKTTTKKGSKKSSGKKNTKKDSKKSPGKNKK